jgi:hypothetical protein
MPKSKIRIHTGGAWHFTTFGLRRSELIRFSSFEFRFSGLFPISLVSAFASRQTGAIS